MNKLEEIKWQDNNVNTSSPNQENAKQFNNINENDDNENETNNNNNSEN